MVALPAVITSFVPAGKDRHPPEKSRANLDRLDARAFSGVPLCAMVFRVIHAAALASALSVVGACSGSRANPGSGTSQGGGGGGPAPVVDPASFDCTAKSAPIRASKVPLGCATDPSCTTRLVIAHRAAGGQLGVIAPENTIAAIRAGIVMGVDYIETDPRPTKDGVLVNVHDTTVDRTTDGTGEVSQMTYAEIAKLHLKSDKYPGDFSCERVPTIQQVLAASRGKAHVLLDANKTDQVQLLVDAVHQTDTLAWAIFDTSSVDKIDKALALEPKLYTMIRVKDQADLQSQLAHFAAHPPVIVEIEGGADVKAMVAAIHAAKNRASTDVFGTDLAANFNSDPKLYGEALASGIDLIETDRPELVLKFLGRWTLP